LCHNLPQVSREWASLGHTPPISGGTEIELRTTSNTGLRGQFKALDQNGLAIATTTVAQLGDGATIQSLIRFILAGIGFREFVTRSP
jgi:hypothetical protein